jgi:Flp pilus assembly protein TadD
VYRYLLALVCSALFSLACRSASGQQTAVDDIPALTARVRQSPEDPNANYSLGLAYFRQQRLREARPFLDRAAALSPAEPDVWKALGLVLLGLDDFAAAVEPLRHACELASGDPDACYLEGRALFLQARYDEAVKPLETALRKAPAADQAKINRAAALNFDRLGSAADAESHFRAAIRAHPYRERARERSREDPRLDYGAFLARHGRAAEALEPLQQALAAFPGSPQANAELGRALLDLDRPQAALPRLQKAVELDPAAWTVRMLLGKAYLRLGRAEEGERELRIGREGWAAKDHSSRVQ